jgi:hypothetical protein
MDNEDALVYLLRHVSWQWFGSLTFYDKRAPHRTPPEWKQISLAFAWMRTFCRWYGVHFTRGLLWVLRAERGERNAREHLHGLFAGLPVNAMSLPGIFAAKNSWERFGGGNARLRRFNAIMEDGSYLLKPDLWNGGDAYESAKFGSGACRLFISHTTWEQIAQSRGVSPELLEFRKKHDVGRPLDVAYGRCNPLSHPYDSTRYTLSRYQQASPAGL